jgi:hypothetical protein
MSRIDIAASLQPACRQGLLTPPTDDLDSAPGETLWRWVYFALGGTADRRERAAGA